MRQLVRRQPVRDLEGMLGDLERWLTFTPGRFIGRAKPEWFAPPCEVVEKDGEVLLRLDAPGVDAAKDLEVKVDGDVLSVSGERRQTAEDASDKGSYREVSYGRFERSLTLPEGTDVEHISARYERGVLEISLPVAQRADAASKKIEVASSESAEKTPVGTVA